ncbi:MAG TPA: PAS domain S-box protein, partial [Syntrophorhabdaceae bacterium]|nr:PAS domain S-box protein [Syntrophorhabdaceae bacterium]
ELALMEKEKTYRTILENLPIGFFRTTPDGTYVMANKALAEMYGYLSPEELINNVKDIGKEIFVNPEERSILIETLEKFGHIENFEAKRYRKDKTIIWTLTSARKVTDDCGKTIYYEGTTIDITHRRRLEDELFKEKEKFSILTENAPFATALIDKNGTYLYINKKFKEIFGYDLSDIPDRDAWFKKAYPDEDYRNKVVYSWKEDLETLGIGESTSKRFTVTCKDGSKKIVEIMPVILVSGLFLITYVDITEKENVEENYRSIFENATEGIAQTTLDGKVIIANPAFVKMLGYTSLEEILNEIKNIPAQIYVNPQDREKLLKLIKSYKNVKGFETQFYRKDGTTIWVSIDISGIYDEKGNITYLHSIVEDITDKKKKEEELTHLRQQYTHAQKMEALGTLTGGIAHDFNNFLTAIMGYANLAQLKISKDFHIKRYIDQIQNVAGNMADLVKNLLAFSRKQPTKLMPLDVNTEVKETKKLLKRLLTENIELSILPSDKNPIVMADKTQLNQILFNMATNARDAMPEGGRFTVRIDTTTMDKDFIKTHGFGKKGNYALMSISDTGIGIDKEIMDKIFDPFFTTKEPGYGTGLGLASVYGIVKQHKGYITVDSTPGSGTTFNIYLPLIDITPKEE